MPLAHFDKLMIGKMYVIVLDILTTAEPLDLQGTRARMVIDKRLYTELAELRRSISLDGGGPSALLKWLYQQYHTTGA